MGKTFSPALDLSDFQSVSTSVLIPKPSQFGNAVRESTSTTYSAGSSPYDRLATVRYSYRVNNDVYKNTPISPNYYSPNKAGKEVAVSMIFVVTESDDNDSSYRRDHGVKLSIAVTLPDSLGDPGIAQNGEKELTEVLAALAGGLTSRLVSGPDAPARFGGVIDGLMRKNTSELDGSNPS